MRAADENERRRVVVDGAAELPNLDHSDLWTTLAAAVQAQAFFDEVGFTTDPVVDLR